MQIARVFTHGSYFSCNPLDMWHNTPVMSNYYITKPGEAAPQGPMSLDDIKAGLANGDITNEHFCCAEGGSKWLPVNEIASPSLPPVMPTAPAPTATAITDKPDNQLVWSILVLIFCCLPAGIYTLIKSTSVDSLWMQGQHDAAKAAAEEAKKWNKIAAIVAGCFWALYILFYVVVIIMSIVAEV